MTYRQAMAQLREIGLVARKNQLKTLEALVTKMEKSITESLKVIQNYIMVYGKLPVEETATLYASIDKEMGKLTKQLQKELNAHISKTAKQGIIDARLSGKPLESVIAYGGKVTLAQGTFEKIWDDAIKKLLTNPEGIKVSSRIWQSNQVTLMDIKKHIAKMKVAGAYPSEIAKEIRGFLILPDVDMRTKFWKQWFKDNPPGKGVYRSAAKNLERIIRTENGRAYRKGTEEYAKLKNWVMGLKWNRVPGYIECIECEEYATHDSGLGEGVYTPGELPVSHPNCYSKDTRVLTDKGFKYFYDVERDDKIMSLDTKTLKMEYVDWTEKVEYEYKGEMIGYKHRGVDLLVTPNHRMLIRKNWKGKLYVKEAEELFDEKEYRFLRTGKWIPDKKEQIDIWLARFYGWYIAEGSVVKRGPNWYQLAIAQQKPYHRDRIKEVLTHLNIKYREDEQQISFNGEFAEAVYNLGLGKSYEKFIPDFIKNADKKIIEAFLEEYCKGDGHRRETDCFGFKSDEVSYSTSSVRLKDDVCELLLKVGKSFHVVIQVPKGTVQVHRNGTYTTNWDVYSIRESKSKHIRIRENHVTRHQYDDKVFCLELEKNGIMFVERGGYGLWCGNCQCYLTIEVAEDALKLEKSMAGVA